MAQKRPKRYTYWSFVMWEESAPEHWVDILNSLQIAAAVSPLHDKDVWDYGDEEVRDGKHEAGEPKKAHWHVNLYYESLKTFEQVLEDLEPLQVKFIKNIRSKRAADKFGHIQFLIRYIYIIMRFNLVTVLQATTNVSL